MRYLILFLQAWSDWWMSHLLVLSFSSVLWFVEKCYEPLHLKYYDIGESWGRIYMRNVELCTCLSGGVTCERTRYTGMTNSNTWYLIARGCFFPFNTVYVCVCVACLRNSCANDGVCRMIEATGEEVCGCTSGFIGQYCNISECKHTNNTHRRANTTTLQQCALGFKLYIGIKLNLKMSLFIFAWHQTR